MPNRIVREGIISSDRVDALDWAGEVFYRRLLNKVDDHGLFDARPSMLRASLYPLKLDRVREADCSRWLAMCEKAGLIALYEADGKKLLKVLDTRWQVRSDPKYPLPSPDNTCNQLQSVEHLDVDVVVDEDGPRKRGSPKKPLPKDFGVSERVGRWAHERGIQNLDRHFEHFVGVAKAKGYKYVDWDEALMNAVRNDWAKIGSGAKRVAM